MHSSGVNSSEGFDAPGQAVINRGMNDWMRLLWLKVATLNKFADLFANCNVFVVI